MKTPTAVGCGPANCPTQTPSHNPRSSARSAMPRSAAARVLFAVAIASVALTGCAHNANTNPTSAVSPEQRILQFNQVVSTANSNLVPVVAALKDAGVLKPDLVTKIATYQVAVASVTSGIATIISQPGSWTDRAIKLQNLALSQVPPAGYKTFGVQSDAQFQSLVVAIDGMESTLQVIVQLAQQQAQGTAAVPAVK